MWINLFASSSFNLNNQRSNDTYTHTETNTIEHTHINTPHLWACSNPRPSCSRNHSLAAFLEDLVPGPSSALRCAKRIQKCLVPSYLGIIDKQIQAQISTGIRKFHQQPPRQISKKIQKHQETALDGDSPMNYQKTTVSSRALL